MTENSGDTSASTAAPTNGEVAAVNGAEQPAAENNEQPQRSYWEITRNFLSRAIFMYFIINMFRRPSTTDPNNNNNTLTNRLPALNYYENSSIFDLAVYLSEFSDLQKPGAEKTLLFEHKNLVYGDWVSGPNGDGSYTFETTIEATENLRNNKSLYMHTFVIKREEAPKKKGRDKMGVAYAFTDLVKFKKLRFTKTKNLLTGESEMTDEQIEQAEKTNQVIVAHWHPNMTINLVTDFTSWVEGTVPSPLNEHLVFSPTGDYYKPVVFYNEFWNLLRDYQPINETTKTLDLRVTFQPLSLFKWQMYLGHSMRSKFTTNIFPETDDEEQDSLKEALLETSPYLLGATVVVSLLHMVFELLAFKNDIQFWKNKKSLEGLSVRSVFFNVFQSLIVLLYVLDNDTNTLIKISCFLGLCIEIWKINKVVNVSLDRERKLFGVIPRPVFKDKGSYVDSSTRQYDELAFKYLSWALFPLLAGYAVYSLLYLQHKGWYSWVLNMIYGFLLTFGFIMMTPQLFINYKLKSVAHLPWRMMSYKCLNTFIDDIFAFVIKMPTMYRLGCFRDDIIFFVFLYQRWIYKIDPSRVNEFGFSAEMENDQPQEAIDEGAQKSIEEKKED
ncbi:Cleft lip and palate transmembrane protein [Nesidiocoris tenuis]|uniref:Cleft lip and palate transmembrane protein n=1 Tax=Nesidiocoris tenuis TaxID=355587 RepID=A0ABN7A9D7_9HEMI|nr:Cleft lip and palate transmembrane protein [Nesidiocoris tenuis]